MSHRGLTTTVAIALTAALTTSTLMGCSKSSAGRPGGATVSGGNLLIADIDEFSGPVSTYATPARNGAEIAIDEVNAAGGIKSLGGANLTLKSYDTQSKPDQGVPQATKAVADHPVAIIGGAQGATVLAASNVTHRVGIPWMTTALSSNQITDRGYKDLFMAVDGHSSLDALMQMLKPAADKLGISGGTVAFVYSQGTFGVSTFESWKALKDNPFKTIAEISYPPTTTDFSSIAARVAAANADIILAGCYPGDCIALSRLWKSSVKPSAKFAWMAGASSVTTVSELKGLADGLIMGGVPDAGWKGAPDQLKAFVKTYKEKYNADPQASSYAGYVNIKFIAKALETCKCTDANQLTDEIHRTTLSHDEGNLYPSPQTLEWSDRGTMTTAPTFFVQVQNGVPAPVAPDAVASSAIQAYTS